jgi:hypothetical protein
MAYSPPVVLQRWKTPFLPSNNARELRHAALMVVLVKIALEKGTKLCHDDMYVSSGLCDPGRVSAGRELSVTVAVCLMVDINRIIRSRMLSRGIPGHRPVTTQEGMDNCCSSFVLP